MRIALPPKYDFPYRTRHERPAVGDVIPVVVGGVKVSARVAFWNRFGIWLRDRHDDSFLWLSLREMEFNYARYW